jgi:hypothetical protein
MKQSVFGTALLVGLIVFLWYFSSVVSDLNAWNAWDQPAEVAKMIKAGVFGLLAFAGAIGVDVKQIFASVTGGGAPPVAPGPSSQP